MHEDPKKAARLAALREVIELLDEDEVSQLMPKQEELPPAVAAEPEPESDALSPEDEELLKAKLAELLG